MRKRKRLNPTVSLRETTGLRMWRLVADATCVTRQGRQASAGRAGTTLTEVLMSLMIMSIGLVSVSTLFPIATLRTLEASRQTNSTITRFNSEALLDIDPPFIHNPDGVWPPGGADTTPYDRAFVGRNYIVDPLGWQEFNYDPANPANPQPASPLILPPPAGNSPRDYFGNTPAALVNVPPPRRYPGATLFPIPYPSTAAELIAARIRASELVAQPDNWKLVTESQAQSVTTTTIGGVTGITGIYLDNDADLSPISLAPGAYYRAIIFDIEGTHSETRVITNVSPTTFSFDWLSPSPEFLPTRFEVSPLTGATPNIGKVRIEVYEQVYTWMLTVRKRPSGPASVDVVVFAKRNFNPVNETVFDGEFRMWNLGPNGVPGGPGDDNGVNGANDVAEAGYPGSDDVPNSIVTIKVPSAALDDERPKLRRGGYVFDTANGLWYRIRAIQNKQFGVGPGSSEDWVDVVLEETIRANSTDDLNASLSLDLPFEDRNGDGILTRGGVIVHPSVVNVFPLEIKQP